jgi:alkaline phosphatase D
MASRRLKKITELEKIYLTDTCSNLIIKTPLIDNLTIKKVWYSPLPEFLYGVASGDPLFDRVILWTHAKFKNLYEPVILIYEVSLDNSFTNVVVRNLVIASNNTGFTVKVDVIGLSPDTKYFYRFRYHNTISPIGQTRTLPLNSNSLKMAVVSCSNYPSGFFNIYKEIANSDCDIVLHLGDYIYEFSASPTAYGSQNAAVLNRVSVPAHEIVTLDDYRLRHAQYKSDTDSQNMHSKFPMIAIWDDHEIADNAYMTGAQNHKTDINGSWETRKAASIQAYHEWMPIRTGLDKSKIYRSFKWGNLVDLHMLDTRQIGREKQLNITDILGLSGKAAQRVAIMNYNSSTRELLGTEQMTWLEQQMTIGTSIWTVLGQQVLMARMEVPSTFLRALNNTNLSPSAIIAYQKAFNDYFTAKKLFVQKKSLTTEQIALLNPTINPKFGYNLDAWDGYIYAREKILKKALQLRKNLISLSGDTHNAWYSNLTLKGLSGLTDGYANIIVGREFSTSSVTSPGFEKILSPITPAQIKFMFENIIDDLKWIDTSKRGYLKMTFTPTSVKGEWIFIDTISSKLYTSYINKELTVFLPDYI